VGCERERGAHCKELKRVTGFVGFANFMYGVEDLRVDAVRLGTRERNVVYKDGWSGVP